MKSKTKFIPCKDCGSSKDVGIISIPDSYHYRVFFSVCCQSEKCRARWWPLRKFPLSTGRQTTEEIAIEKWNKGNVENANFSSWDGGRWTGD